MPTVTEARPPCKSNPCRCCGNPVRSSGARGPKPHYCSAACKARMKAAMKAARLDPRRCVRCGTSYKPTGDRQRFCSILCANQSKASGWGQCYICGTDFERKGSESRCCSKACGSTLSGIGQHGRLPQCVCRHCGTVFVPKQGNRTTFCGRPCMYAARAAKASAKGPRTIGPCIDCGAPASSVRSRVCDVCRENRKAAYSRDRYARLMPTTKRTCRQCRVEFEARGTRVVYCGDACANKAHKRRIKRRRRARERDGGETVLLEVVGKRDKWICGICRKPVDRKAQVPHPDAPTRDHIHPLSKGGKHIYSNVQLAHFECNRLKCDKCSIDNGM
jgi:hypothetical protein